ncbi:MAG: superfamily II RNA helicase, partial [Planctomycetota bacterium]
MNRSNVFWISITSSRLRVMLFEPPWLCNSWPSNREITFRLDSCRCMAFGAGVFGGPVARVPRRDGVKWRRSFSSGQNRSASSTSTCLDNAPGGLTQARRYERVFCKRPPPTLTSPSAPGEEPHEEDSPLDATVTHWRQFKLSSFQIRSVAAIRAGHNVLVAAPTGAGKTLVAEYAIEDAAKQGKRCIYTSPIKALSNQKYRDFRDDPDVDVGIMTGDVTINPAGQVLVMTTEILRNAIFESPGLLNDVEFVIFDEIHYMDDRERGTVWEESLIFLPESVRLICLSATISNVDEMGAWLEEIRIQKMEIVRSNKRPVPLSHWGFTKRSGAFDASKQESILKMEQRAGGGNRPRRSSRGRGRGRGGRGDDAADPGKLFDMLEERSLLPALVFSFSRKDCERLARRGMARNLLNEEEQKRVHALARELITVFKLDEGELKGEIFNMAFQGVAYHHAGMLPIHKEIVERLFTAGLIRLLFTTETFALGINMPARSVVFNALRKYDGVSFDWLRVRDYMQMAGRAGRQGIDDKGYVYSMLDG